MQDYTKLDVYKLSYNLALCIYAMTKDFPREELYGITAQLRRAIVSISLNIAEGCAKFSPKDKKRFFNISVGSINESVVLINLSTDLKYINSKEEADKMHMTLIEIRRKLINLIKVIKE